MISLRPGFERIRNLGYFVAVVSTGPFVGLAEMKAEYGRIPADFKDPVTVGLFILVATLGSIGLATALAAQRELNLNREK